MANDFGVIINKLRSVLAVFALPGGVSPKVYGDMLRAALPAGYSSPEAYHEALRDAFRHPGLPSPHFIRCAAETLHWCQQHPDDPRTREILRDLSIEAGLRPPPVSADLPPPVSPEPPASATIDPPAVADPPAASESLPREASPSPWIQPPSQLVSPKRGVPAAIEALRALFPNGDPGQMRRWTVLDAVNGWLKNRGWSTVEIATLYRAFRRIRSSS